MFRKLFSIIAVLTLTTVLSPAFASAESHAAGQAIKPVQVTSAQSFDKTVVTLKKLVAKNGMMVMGEINQGKIMSMTGVSLKAVSFFIGNPVVGKKLFSEDAGATVAAPFRVTIYQAKNGKTVISYYQPSELLASFNSEKIKMVAKKLDQQLAMLASNSGK